MTDAKLRNTDMITKKTSKGTDPLIKKQRKKSPMQRRGGFRIKPRKLRRDYE